MITNASSASGKPDKLLREREISRPSARTEDDFLTSLIKLLITRVNGTIEHLDKGNEIFKWLS